MAASLIAMRRALWLTAILVSGCIALFAQAPSPPQTGGKGDWVSHLFLSVDGLTLLVLIVQSVLLWWTIREMTTSDERQLRAYVSFEIHAADPKALAPYVFTFSCVNHGTTPAKNIGFRAGVWLLPLPLDSFSKIPKIADGFDEERMNLFPGDGPPDKKKWITVNTKSTFSSEDLYALQRGQSAFIVGLKIRYQDMFDQWHETQEYYATHYRGGYARFLVPGHSVIT